MVEPASPTAGVDIRRDYALSMATDRCNPFIAGRRSDFQSPATRQNRSSTPAEDSCWPRPRY